MSAATAAAEPRAVPRDANSRPGLTRLTAVELRKMVDTRAGFWLLVGVVLLTVVVVVARVLSKHGDHSLTGLFVDPLQVPSTFLPVIGILLVSSEWSQRTALVTFSLVPRRLRVLSAKLFAGTALSLVAFGLTAAVAAIAVPFAAHPAGSETWALPAWLVGQQLLMVVSGMLVGIGFGAMLLSSAPAIVLYYVLPIGFMAVGHVAWLEFLARWFDASRTLTPMADHALTATEWAHAGATFALWLVVPLAIGAWRIARGEIS
jgi:ABC-2 type transport system permease protein